MKKHINAIVAFLLTFAILTVYGCSSNNEYVNDLRNTDIANNNSNTSSTSNAQKDPLDPFKNLIVEFDGISPYCTISFNNSQCSKEVQQYVQYSIEPYEVVTNGQYFKTNEDVTVYAVLNDKDETCNYYLVCDKKNYKVKGVPEYITEITNDMDLSTLKAEINDYLDSITAFSEGTHLGSWKFDGYGYEGSKDFKKDKIYFSALKMSSYNQIAQGEFFNKVDVLCSIKIKSHSTYDNLYHNRYFSVVAKNVVKYPDGTIGWGKDDPRSLSFEYNVDSTNMESLINSNITSIKGDYNVMEITDILKL